MVQMRPETVPDSKGASTISRSANDRILQQVNTVPGQGYFSDRNRQRRSLPNETE